jgi:putative ATP-binding cassette transporter
MRDSLALLGFLSRLSRHNRVTSLIITASVLSGVIGGLGNTALIAMINDAIHGQTHAPAAGIWVFAALCVVVAGSRFLSQYSLANVASRSVFELRMGLCSQVLATPLRSLEQIGLGRILAHLTDDVGAVSEGLVQIPVLLVNTAVITGCLAYLGWLSWHLLLAFSVIMIGGIAAYQWPVRKSAAFFREARRNWGELYSGFQGLTQGIKELQLHQGRKVRFYENKLVRTAGRVRRNALHGYVALAAANSCGQVLFFAGLGALLFAGLRFWPVPDSVATGYALVLLFMISPIEAIFNMMPSMSRARVAAEQLQQLDRTMIAVSTPEWPTTAPKRRWHEIRLNAVTHHFRGAGDDDPGFTLGPVDLALEPGEIVFLVGGNGSGKTTLAKLLAGLYLPESGHIALDGLPVHSGNLDEYRSHFSAVFADFHLFDSLLGLDRPGLDQEALECLRLLRLDHKVRIEHGRFSTIDLSQGQRKRLALLTAYLEDRPIYVFDEWSADQEPVFREVFYRHLLPGLRARSKTVVVITHDDRYFDAADRVIELEYGHIRNERGVRKGTYV